MSNFNYESFLSEDTGTIASDIAQGTTGAGTSLTPEKDRDGECLADETNADCKARLIKRAEKNKKEKVQNKATLVKNAGQVMESSELEDLLVRVVESDFTDKTKINKAIHGLQSKIDQLK